MSAVSRIPGLAPAADRASAADRRLVERAQRGDAAAFGELYQRHVDHVYAYIRLRVGDTAVAEDLTQDVFFSAYRGLTAFTWRGTLAPWLLRVAHNHVVNHWRMQSRRPQQVVLPGDDDPDDMRPELAEPDAGDGYVLDIPAQRLEASISCLTDLQQQVVALRFAAGLSLAETAEVMDRSVNAVKNLQHKALHALRLLLEAEGVVP